MKLIPCTFLSGNEYGTTKYLKISRAVKLIIIEHLTIIVNILETCKYGKTNDPRLGRNKLGHWQTPMDYLAGIIQDKVVKDRDFSERQIERINHICKKINLETIELINEAEVDLCRSWGNGLFE